MRSNIVSDKIKKAIDSFSMLKAGDTVLVGFSGGKDSVVLLYTLNCLTKEYSTVIKAVHVNHNIRGEEAERDEKFCETFCKKHNIELIKVSVNAVEYSEENKIGLEEGARKLRYDAFEKIARLYKNTKIATAHSASDNMETVLFNLARGSSSEGLRGIPPVRDNIIRPLIYCTTEEILEEAKSLSLDYVTDSTNLDTDYTRNHIRHNIVPLLKEINPKAENAFSSMSDSIRQDVDYINKKVRSISNTSPEHLSKLPPSLLNRVLIKLYKEKATDTQLSGKNIYEMTALIKECSKNMCTEEKRLSLPGKIDFVCTPSQVYFKKHFSATPLGKHILHMGENFFEETGDTVYISKNEADFNNIKLKNVYKKSIHTVLKNTIPIDTIFVRGRENGDVFKFSNITKKVKKMLNEAKIPLDTRNNLPMFCDDKGILWIPEFPLRDDFKPTNNDEVWHIYYLTQEATND